MPAKKDLASLFESVWVHFRSDKAKFEPEHLKVSPSRLSVPTKWRIKPLTEIGLELELPAEKKAVARSIKCRGIAVDCRPLKKKGHYQVDLLLTHVPPQYTDLTQKISGAAGAEK